MAPGTTTGEEDVGVDLRDVMVMSQNSMLKKELAELRKRIEDAEKVKVAGDFKGESKPAPVKGTFAPSPPPPPKLPEERQCQNPKEL